MRAEHAAQAVAERSDGGVVLEDEDVLEGGDLAGEPLLVEPVQPGHVDHAQGEPAFRVGEQMIDGTPSVQPNAPAYWGSQRGTFGAGGILADGRIFDSILSERDIAAVAQQPPQ